MKAFYCVGTHWDREWYEPFQEFRMWLVELIDELLDMMEEGDTCPYFHLDGQAVVLQDYLDIRPENRDRIVKLLKEGRIVAGPWYVLPDEWLISGESYVRNIMIGMHKCRELGVEPAQFAYTPDQFGHIAALPMIMTGFGLKAGIVWRGTQDETYPAHFVWIGPDGSRMVTHKLMDKGSYSPFGLVIRDKIKDADYSDAAFKEHFEPLLSDEKNRTNIPLVLLLDAIDHQPAPKCMSRMMQELKKRYPDVEFIWSTMPKYGEEMLKYADQLPERTGELREPCRDAHRVGQYLIVHTISSRYPIKKRNDECQAAMEKWVEPCALFQLMSGCKPILSYLDVAWEYLVKNHPHDSICGCSIDQVHRDMKYRFDQCELIADGVVRRAMTATAKASAKPEDRYNVVVHNPLPFTRKGVVEIPVEFSPDWPSKYIDGLATSERVNRFRLVKKDGTPLPFQVSGIERDTAAKATSDIGRHVPRRADIYHLAVEMELPSCGFTGFRVEETEDAMRNFGTLMSDTLSAGNGKVEFTLNPDGTAALEDLETGRSFYGLFQYEDCGDSGDGWTFGPLMNDIVFRGPGSRVNTAIQENGPLRTVFRVEREFNLPRRMERGSYLRSEDRIVTHVTDHIYIEKDRPYIRVRTRIENNTEDHRFRVLFPTNIPSDRSFADTPFAIVERDIPIPAETATWHERISPEKAFTSLFGVQSDAGGLAVLAPFGLHEYEVTQTLERALALTLFRSTRQTVNTAGEPDGLLLGTMEFEYLLYPFAGEFDPVEAGRIVAEAQTGLRIHQTAELPDDTSFIQFKNGSVLVTAVKPAADRKGGVIRLWNPTESDKEETVTFSVKITSAALCDLNEQPKETLKVGKGGVAVNVPARGLTTVRFDWA